MSTNLHSILFVCIMKKKVCTLGLIHYMREVVKKSVTLYTMLLYKDLY